MGRLDPLTSVEDADKVMIFVPHAQRVVVHSSGHAPGIASSCGRTAITTFLADTIAREGWPCSDNRPIAFATDDTTQWHRVRDSDSENLLSFPRGWVEVQPGRVHTRYISNDITLMQRIAQGDLTKILDAFSAPQTFEGDVEYVPVITGSREFNGTEWTLYKIERASGVVNRIGIGKFGERFAVVMITTMPGVDAKEDVLTILLSAIDRMKVN